MCAHLASGKWQANLFENQKFSDIRKCFCIFEDNRDQDIDFLAMRLKNLLQKVI